jgi:hypothetical protein
MTRRKRGPIRILFGLVMIVVGLAGVGTGIVASVNERDRIEDEAVARGTLPGVVRFTGAEPREYRVFLVGENAKSLAARTACMTSSSGRFSGSAQRTRITLGSASSVGMFDAPRGDVFISCNGPQGTSFFVTPAAGGLLRSILMIVGGAFVAVGGLLLAIWGLVGRRVAA